MRTIFFAHDQQEDPESRKHLLELAGYVVRLFPSFAALESALQRDEAPCLVLIDTFLEGKNGFDASRTLTKSMPERSFPIVLCSQAYRSRPFREEALKCGAQDYLLMPMASDEFLRRTNQSIAYFVPPGGEKNAA